MREKPDMPLTPVKLFRRGIEITREIRDRIEEARAYYLGRSSREPAQPLSEVFDPMHGPILKYFIETIRIITRTRFIECCNGKAPKRTIATKLCRRIPAGAQ